MKRIDFRAALMGCIMLLAVGSLPADDRAEPVDILVALDKSLSMEEEIEAVKEYVNVEIVDSLLQNGDFFLIVGFYGDTNIIVSDFIKGDDHKDQVKDVVSSIAADGRFTDIGNALDTLKAQVETYSSEERRKTLLLITDGKHEPPPGSIYYSTDGSYSHEYLKVTSETQKEGWKIIVIGLGDQSAQEIAEALSAEYAEAEESPSAAELKEIIPDLTGVISMLGEPDVSPVDRKNRATLSLRLQTKDFSESPRIGIQAIRLETPEHSEGNVLAESYGDTLPAEGETELVLELQLNGTLPAGRYEGVLTFDFSSKEHFPENLDVSFRVKSFLQNYPWIIPVGVLGVGALAFLLFLAARKIGKGRKVAFRLLVEEQPLKKGRDTFTARLGKSLYLKESMDMFDVAEKKTANAIAAIALTDAGLTLSLLKEDRFPGMRAAPKNVLGETYVVRTESGKDFHVTFINV